MFVEGTGKWPEDPEAFYKLKAALGLQIAVKLREAHGYESLPSEDAVDVLGAFAGTCRPGIDGMREPRQIDLPPGPPLRACRDQTSSYLSPSAPAVDGFAFRLFLQTDRDELVRRVIEIRQKNARALSEAGGLSGPLPFHLQTPDEAAYSPLRRLARNGIPDAAWLHGVIDTVGGMYTAFVPTVRLAKAWVAAHSLSNHLSEEAVELMVAKVFSGAGVGKAPVSRLTGLLRFLSLLGSWPFANRPLFVDPSGEMPEQQRAAVFRSFQDRKQGGVHVPGIFLSTARDPESRLYTHEAPTADITARIQLLAAGSARLLEAAAMGGAEGKRRIVVGTSAWMHTGRAGSAVPPGGSASALCSLSVSLRGPALNPRWPLPDLLQAPEDLVEKAFDPKTVLSECDVVLALRKEALPHADRCGGHPSTSAHAAGNRPPSALSSAPSPIPPTKASRAVLRHIPAAVVQQRGPKRLRSELLVGFSPLPMLVQQ